jgi:probable F420-dependent oxidoreductase
MFDIVGRLTLLLRRIVMEIGTWIFATDYCVDPAVLAQRAEELGFASFWVPEHPIIPVRQQTGFRGIPGEPIPKEYYHILDPFVALAKACGVTRRIKLGTGICLVPERNPLLLAKEVATLDYLSGGRFLFGIGAGWLREETEIMGGDFPHRWSQVREAVLAMKELWTKEEAEFHGRFYDFPPVHSNPKPAQKPHPPVLLGGFARNVFQRIVAWGDGWLPFRVTPEQVKQGRAALDELASAAGRDPRSITITVYGQAGDAEQVKEFEEAGADHLVVRIPILPEKEALEELEKVASQTLE